MVNLESRGSCLKQLSLLCVVGFVVVFSFERRSHYRALAGLELSIGTQNLLLDFLGFSCVLLYLDVGFEVDR